MVSGSQDQNQRYVWARVISAPPRTYTLLARFTNPQDQPMAEKFFQSFQLDPKKQR